MVLRGFLNKKEVRGLTGDGCSTIVISKTFIKENPELFSVANIDVAIAHLKKDIVKSSHLVVSFAGLQIGSHRYRTNWASSGLHFDVSLEMSWHEEMKPRINYGEKEVLAEKTSSPLIQVNREIIVQQLQIMNLGVKTFKCLITERGQRHDHKIFQGS